MHDAGVRRHDDLKPSNAPLAPAQERVALLVALELALGVDARTRRACRSASTCTEWSMTSSAGTSGLISAASPPSSTIASRIAARSTTAGTPVKSCISDARGVNGDLLARLGLGVPARERLDVVARVTGSPSSLRSRFSSRIFSENGSRATSCLAPERVRPVDLASRDRRPTASPSHRSCWWTWSISWFHVVAAPACGRRRFSSALEPEESVTRRSGWRTARPSAGAAAAALALVRSVCGFCEQSASGFHRGPRRARCRRCGRITGGGALRVARYDEPDAADQRRDTDGRDQRASRVPGSRRPASIWWSEPGVSDQSVRRRFRGQGGRHRRWNSDCSCCAERPSAAAAAQPSEHEGATMQTMRRSARQRR